MRTKLAVLTVYREDGVGDGKSSYTNHIDGTSKYDIVLRPDADKAFDPEGNDQAGVLAHELGHFVAHLFEFPSAIHSGHMFDSMKDQLKAEKDAWRIADGIIPGVSKRTVAKNPMKAYRKAAKKYGNLPRFLITE